ncbi:hypothetical protein LEP1GSC186_2774 [Leptospira noguchii serovar Autumnalis str. ZUN142]|uniref:Uncharacterized protein n=1 Tax=Leptospira noguchii serovar Autumnalis str. ZUN142 TaxID=1085540 RepID=M6UDI6_9LEPT|nr:hypothetical protein LEP1GSC186_2774 [Leptospira noguchii serovar Autumnalis str. ZUN142]
MGTITITDFTVQSRKRGNYYKSRILQLILENVGTITITDFTVGP